MNDKEALQQLKKFEEAAAACNRCGFCTSYCPTYNATGNEVHSPRGRNQMVRAVMEGKILSPSAIKESIDTCLLCGECTSICFSEVPTAKLMMEARNYLNQVQGTPFFLKFFLKTILPYPERLRLVLKISFLAKTLGVSWVLRKTGVLKHFFPTLNAADALLKKVPLRFLLDYRATRPHQERVRAEREQRTALKQTKGDSALKPDVSPTTARIKVAFMPVCGNQYLRPAIGLATIKLFERLNLDFVIPEVACCGLPAASYGVREQEKNMAQDSIARLERGYFDQIVIDDSSCAAHMKDWPSLFQNNSDWIKRAHEIAQKMRDIPFFLVQRGLREHLKLAKWNGGSVAFHDPCKAQYAQRSTNPPRELLNAIPRLTLIPIHDGDQCCGGAGTYSFVHPELSQQVLTAKVRNIIASGCKIVVTSSASCLTQLAFGLRKNKSDIEVLHLTEFLARALEKGA